MSITCHGSTLNCISAIKLVLSPLIPILINIGIIRDDDKRNVNNFLCNCIEITLVHDICKAIGFILIV